MIHTALLLLALTAAPQDRLMSPELLWDLHRLGSPALSSDGALAAYSVRDYDLSENSGRSSVFVVDVATGKSRLLFEGWRGAGELQFAPTPFGERVLFAGRPDVDGASTQVWSLNVADGSLKQVTNVEGGVANVKVSPTGEHVAYTVDVKLDPEVTEIYEDLPKADARIIDTLMYRHWNAWHDFSYSHLCVAPIDDEGRAGEHVDLMEGMRVDSPVPPFGGSEQYAWAPDGKSLAFTMKEVERWAESTDSDVYLVSLDAPTERRNVSDGRDGYDNDPFFSPDGQRLGWHSMERPGFESDRNRVLVMDIATGEVVEPTKGLDQTVHGARWSPSATALLFTSEWRGTNQLFRMPAEGGEPKQFSEGRYNWDLVELFPDGERALVTRMDMTRPTELAVMNLADGSARLLTDVNGAYFGELKLPGIEERWVDATDGKKIHSWVIYPPDFDPAKKYPLLTYCQGGPQGQVGQWFSYRWNFHLMAAQGYIVIAPNRRGLPGFGRAWNDQISGDWGGQAMQDLLSATDSMLAEPYVDKARTAAVGASYGGYSVYWLMGNHGDRFQAMIAHCGVFNLESMYGSTEELFFVNHDLGGPYWSSPEIQAKYDRFSPNRYVGNWNAPLLVIHGEKDFRVPVTQGMEAFTAAQVEGIPSRFLYFPEEGHWVQSPQNGVVWHRVFFEWLGDHCGPK
ncbi:Prolyl tripeptidyl peptidase precursor [Planctomycetes bacterium Poly30]|uniref:Prolyl tripeptidyl peptidase n=1 Tax=Saltatorellus ferox TaxID=2528018 RepID=A0A518EKB0_9BACT|nr:Prolyl tripeptidyl peptidase precursor [Planctomycetes bacterium Poly30]